VVPVELSALVNAVLKGAQRFARVAGRVYSRRSLTAKQAKLLGLLADGDGIGMAELKGAFPQEWETLAAAHPDRAGTANERAFFQNVADMAGRLNAYLLAGYEDGALGPRMVGSLGNRYVGLAYSYEALELSPVSADTLEELKSQIHPVDGNEHAPRRRRRPEVSSVVAADPVPTPAATKSCDPACETAQPAAPPTEEATTDPPPAVPASGQTPSIAEITSPDTSPVALPVASPLAPPPLPPALPRMAAPHLEASVDPITGRWLLDIGDPPVEVHPRVGLVLVGGRLVRWPGESLPEDPERATPEQVRLLLSLLPPAGNS
jgi:hypothetical protein